MSKFTVVTCENYASEVRAVLKDMDLSDVDVAILPTDCTNCLRNRPHEMASFLASKAIDIESYWLLGDLDSPSSVKNNHHMCQSVLVNPSLIAHWLASGYFLVTPGWLKRWRHLVYEDWGFQEHNGAKFLSDNIQKILLLDSGVYKDSETDLSDFAMACQVVPERLTVGIDFISSSLKKAYLQWKLSSVEVLYKSERQRSAEYLMAFDLIVEHSGIQQVKEVISRIEKIGLLLTAAKSVCFMPTDALSGEGVAFVEATRMDWEHERQMSKPLMKGQSKSTSCDLTVSIQFGQLKLGDLLFEEILFSEQIGRYKNLFRNLAPVFAVNLMNASHFEALEREKNLVERANHSTEVYLSMMSHEVRGPLNGVSGALQLIRLAGLDENQNELLEIGENALKSLLETINNVLDYVKVKSGSASMSFKPFIVEQLLEETFALFKGISLLKGVQFIETIDESAKVPLLGSAETIKQVLVNLIGNAFKFTEKGKVEVRVALLKRSQEGICFLEFKVMDTGIGIPENKLESIFEAFEQGDNLMSSRYGGTGLGLAIAKEQVALLGGEIVASNGHSGGSCFAFTCVVRQEDII